VITKPQGRYLGLAWMTLGLCMYFRIRKKGKLKPTGHVLVEQITIPGYHPLDVRKILVPTRGGIQTDTVQMACELAKLHRAKIVALQVIEIPATLPLDIAIPHRMVLAEAVLKHAEAIAREIGVEIELQIVRSRSVIDTILEVSAKGRYDLIVLGALKPSREARIQGMGPIAEAILRKAACRVWVCVGKVLKH
jgi:nucleotide-binding universal stress UspA family protein